ncbi:MAG TPA: hypothetical protein VFV73_40575, partial [Streptosporangiaceae bacterium]|nr:hypothetical protein [Streptosporangiaceae bacterium]
MRLLALYGRLLGPLLAGYLMFDKAFAYIHLPGTPLYVGEFVLLTGGLGVLAATGYLRAAIADAPVLVMLGAFFCWGFLRFLPGLRAYGVVAVRDFALVVLLPVRVLHRGRPGQVTRPPEPLDGRVRPAAALAARLAPGGHRPGVGEGGEQAGRPVLGDPGPDPRTWRRRRRRAPRPGLAVAVPRHPQR